MHTSVTPLPATSSNPSTICQQKYGLPTASEDRHEYLCFITSIALKAGKQAGTAAHLATWFPIYPASERKHRLTASNLTERLVSRPPAVTPLGHTDASLPVPPSPQHHDVGSGGKRKSDGDTAIKIKCIPFPFCSLSIQLSILIKRLGPIRSFREEGPWRIRLYCPTLWGGEGYPDSC